MSSTARLKIALIVVVLAAVAALFMEHRAYTELRGDNDSLRQQAGQLEQLSAENERLSNLVAGASSSVAKDQMNELLRLRGEVGTLRRQTNQIGQLLAENRRLQAAQARVAAEPASPSAKPTAAQIQQASIAKLNDARALMLGLVMFAQENQGRLPANLGQADSYLKKSSADPSSPGLTGTNEFEIAYQGSLRDLARPASTIILREKQAWQSADGAWHRAYGFADGHAEVPGSTDGNFDEWEKQRGAAPPAGP